MITMGTFQRIRNGFGMGEQITQILPDQIIQLCARNEPRGTAFFTTILGRSIFSAAGVVTVLTIRARASRAG